MAYYQKIILAICLCQAAIAIRSDKMQATGLEGQEIQAIGEKGQLLHNATSSMESDEEALVAEEEEDDEGSMIELDQDDYEAMLESYQDDDEAIESDQDDDLAMFPEDEEFDPKDGAIEEGSLLEGESDAEEVSSNPEAEARRERMRLAREKRAKINAEIRAKRGGQKLTRTPGRIKQATQKCEAAVIGPCASSTPRGYGVEFCDWFAKNDKRKKGCSKPVAELCADVEKKTVETAVRAAMRTKHVGQDGKEQNIEEDLKKAPRVVLKEEEAMLSKMMFKQLIACICVNRGGGDTCYQGDDGIPAHKHWCNSYTPTWRDRVGVTNLPKSLCQNILD